MKTSLPLPQGEEVDTLQAATSHIPLMALPPLDTVLAFIQ